MMILKYVSLALLLVLTVANAFKIDFCPTCVDFLNNDMSDLEKIISGGVATSCGALCSLLPSNMEQGVCNLLCDIVGIDEFLKAFNDVDNDLDPVYVCEKLKVCPVIANSNAQVLAANVNPVSGPHGTSFSIGVAYEVLSKLGTGEVAVMVTDPTGQNGFGDADLIVNTDVGQYQTTFTFTATPSEQEEFPTGVYQVDLTVCEGACGTKHGKQFNTISTNFTVTPGPAVSGGITGSGSSSGSGSGSGSSGATFF